MKNYQDKKSNLVQYFLKQINCMSLPCTKSKIQLVEEKVVQIH
jgi:hypothetical protein